jgi:threonine synthase
LGVVEIYRYATTIWAMRSLGTPWQAPCLSSLSSITGDGSYEDCCSLDQLRIVQRILPAGIAKITLRDPQIVTIRGALGRKGFKDCIVHYVSTRGAAPRASFDDVLLTGLATDGGLFVPEDWPRFSEPDIRALRGLDYPTLACNVMAAFLGDAIPPSAFEKIVGDAYDTFDHHAVAPLVQLDADLWLMELFHGPTLAFKDVALQLLGRLFEHVLDSRGARVTIVGATSGDTGSAAIEACRDREAMDIVILHPRGRVSEVQRRQMTTVDSTNVHNIAVDGTFDDCQDLVKAMFNDQPFRNELRLAAVNSINWVRIMAQTVYYFHAALALGAPDREVSFSIPTGNFGNVFAAYVARKMGLPVKRLYVGSNRNDILTRFLSSGEMVSAPVEPSLSPSMDIQISSNFERLLFELHGRDGDAVLAAMTAFRDGGRFSVDEAQRAEANSLFEGASLDDTETTKAIAHFYRSTGELLDPHSAIGAWIARENQRETDVPIVSLATAHPAKFPEAVEQATGVSPTLPTRLADLLQRPEHCADLPNDVSAVQEFIRDKVGLMA